MEIIIDTTPAAALATEIANQYGTITAYEITDAGAMGEAGDTLREIQTSIKLIDERRKEITRPLDAAKSEIMEIFILPLAQLDRAKAVIRSAIVSYEEAAQKRRIEAQRAAEERARQEEQERRLELVKAAEEDLAKGRTIAATDKLNRAETVVVIPEMVQPELAAKNVGLTKRWVYEITDQNQIPREYLIPNDAMLKAYARSHKEKASLPGVRVYAENTASLRGVR